MARFFKKREETKGMSPGSLLFIGNKKVENIRIRVIDYDDATLKEDELKDIAEGAEFKKTKTVTWINVDGLHDLSLMKELGKTFDLHPHPLYLFNIDLYRHIIYVVRYSNRYCIRLLYTRHFWRYPSHSIAEEV